MGDDPGAGMSPSSWEEVGIGDRPGAGALRLAGAIAAPEGVAVQAALDAAWTLPARFVDSDDPDVCAFARTTVREGDDDVAQAQRLYNAVRDDVRYDPYMVGREPSYFRASDCLRRKRGFCIPKAALLAAAARAVGIPARVGFANVRNHLSSPRLSALIGGNLYRWHSFAELLLDGRWVKATPAFDRALCERFGVWVLEFDGYTDSLFQEYTAAGDRHMEYVENLGTFADVPYDTIVAAFARHHPRWLANRETPQQRGA